MDVVDTTTHPWREPIDYLTLVFWVIIFVVIAGVVLDILRLTWKLIAETAA